MSSSAATQSRFRRWQRARQWKMSERRRSAVGSAAFASYQRLAEEDDCLADLRLRVADDTDLEHDVRAIDVAEPRRDGERGRLLEERHRLPRARPCECAPTPRSGEAGGTSGRSGRGAGPLARFSKRAPARPRSGAFSIKPLGLARPLRRSSRRPPLLTPCSRNSRSVSRRPASHSSVSGVGRVFPRSIWLTYSLENRPAASSSWLRPAARRSERTRSPTVRTPGSSGRSQSATLAWWHARRRSSRASATRQLVERDRARRCDVQRLRLAGRRDRRLVTLCHEALGQPFALRSEQEGEGRLEVGLGERLRRRGRRARRVAPGARPTRRAARGRSLRQRRAARAGSSDRRTRARARPRLRTRPPFAAASRRSPDPTRCQSASTTSRAPTGRSARRYTPMTRGAWPSVETSPSSSGTTFSPATSSSTGSMPGRFSRLDEVLALDGEEAGLLAVLPRREKLPDEPELLVLTRLDQSI